MKIGLNIFYILTILILPQVNSQTTGNRTVSINLPIVALLNIEPSSHINFSFSAPTEAGLKIISPAANETKWINYSSAITSGGSTRKVIAAVNPTIPGVNIKIKAGSATGIGGGTRGSPTPEKTLSATPQEIITGIGGAYTGNGINNGHKVTITLSVDESNYQNLISSSSEVTITYTITE